MPDDRLIEVCDVCLTAACWYGEFMCELAQTAGTVKLPVATLKTLNREHPDQWSDAKLMMVYGCIPG